MAKQKATRNKLTGNGGGSDSVGKKKAPADRQRKEGSFLLDYSEIEKVMQGKQMKVGEIRLALKKDYRPVYMTLRQMAKNGLAKLVAPGTFVLVKKSAPAPRPKAEPKKKKEAKVEAPAPASDSSGK